MRMAAPLLKKMVLNYIWIAFIVVAFVIGVVKLAIFGDYEVFPAMKDMLFAQAEDFTARRYAKYKRLAGK